LRCAATARGKTLFGFAMRLMATAEAAILAQLHTVGGLLLVFLRVVIAAFALRARHHDHHAILFFSHFYSSKALNRRDDIK
jgi:hypothetical protein